MTPTVRFTIIMMGISLIVLVLCAGVYQLILIKDLIKRETKRVENALEDSHEAKKIAEEQLRVRNQDWREHQS